MLHIPANPCRQRTVLVVLIHGGEVAPLLLATDQLHQARVEVDSKPLPLQQKQACSHRRMIICQTRTASCRREEKRNEARFQQHSVRLVARKILRCTDERQKAHEAHREHQSRPDVEHHQNRGHQPNPANGHQHMRAAGEPEQCWRVPEAPQPKLRQRLQIFSRRQDAVRTNQPLDLKQEWVKRREIDETETAQKDPSRKRAVGGTAFRRKQPADYRCKTPLHDKRHSLYEWRLPEPLTPRVQLRLRAFRADRSLFLRIGELRWQKYIEDSSTSSAAGVAPNANRAAVLLDDPTADPQSESGAILSLGGEEGLENLLLISRRDARSIIGDHHPRPLSTAVVPFARREYVQQYRAAVRDRLNRVSHHIRDHLTDLHRHRTNRDVFFISLHHRDAAASDQRRIKVRNIVKHLGQAYKRRLRRMSVEREHLSSDMRRPAQFLLRNIDALPRGAIETLVALEQVNQVQ